MYVESFHNVLKTYYMERKPNKRVDDLINVLLTYKEDTYWRHKREMIYIKTTTDLQMIYIKMIYIKIIYNK